MLARSPGPYISTIKTSMARTVLGAGALWLHNYIHILILDIHQRVCVCVCLYDECEPLACIWYR